MISCFKDVCRRILFSFIRRHTQSYLFKGFFLWRSSPSVDERTCRLGAERCFVLGLNEVQVRFILPIPGASQKAFTRILQQ